MAPPRPRGAPHKFPQLYDLAWLKSQLDAGRTYVSIAAEVGCSSANVSECARKAGLGRRRRQHRRPNRPLPGLRLGGEASRVFAEDAAVDVEVT
jgi:hypothetical protein